MLRRRIASLTGFLAPERRHSYHVIRHTSNCRNMTRWIPYAVSLLVGCASSSGSIPQRPAPASDDAGVLVVLTADNWLYFADPSAGRIIKRVKLDRDQPWGEIVWPSQRLGESIDGSIVALTSWGNLFQVVPSTGVIMNRVEIGRVYTSLAVAPTSGRVALFGLENLDALIQVRSLDAPVPRVAYRIPGRPGADWVIYGGAWAADESRLYVSYHGSSTTGIDWFSLTQDSLFRCVTRQSPRTGCIDAHGALRVHQDGLIVATGNADVWVVDSAGHLKRRLETGVTGHLMEFALDAAGETLFAAGPCGNGSGFGTVEIESGARTGHQSAYGCAGQIEALNTGLVGLTKTDGVVIIDARSGETMAEIPLPGPIIDILMSRFGGHD